MSIDRQIEACYYVISGRAIMKEMEGKGYDLSPDSVVNTPAGIAGSHNWDIKEALQLLSVSGTTDSEKNVRFSVDPTAMVSSIEFNYSIKSEGETFESH